MLILFGCACISYHVHVKCVVICPLMHLPAKNYNLKVLAGHVGDLILLQKYSSHKTSQKSSDEAMSCSGSISFV